MLSARHLCVAGLLALMEVIAGFAVLLGSGVLSRAGFSDSSFWLFLGVELIAAVLAAAARSLSRFTRLTQLIVLIGGILVVGLLDFAGPHSPTHLAVATLLLGLAYVRGVGQVTEAQEYEDVQLRFGIDLAALFAGLSWALLRGALHQQTIWQPLAVAGVGYLIVGLLTLGVARSESGPRGAHFFALVAVLAQLGLVVLASLLALALFTRDLAGGLGALLSPIGNLIEDILLEIVQILFVPLTAMENFLRSHVSHSHAHLPGRFARQARERHVHQVAGGSNIPLEAIGIVAGAAALLALAFLVWRKAARRRTEPDVGQVEDERTATPLHLVWARLLAWLRALLGRGVKTPLVMAATLRRVLGPSYPSDPVRGLYARLLYRSEKAGLSRGPQTTPDEFERLLAGRWPDASTDFAVLTNAYTLRRYAGVDFDSTDIERLRATWKRLRTIMRNGAA
ncbi:MAG: DUF4129 domain-containing protein [Chloroflexota bacterium]